MRFRDFKRFDESTAEALVLWVKGELGSVMRELFIGLSKLSFENNIKSFEWKGVLQAGEEIQVSHDLSTIPTKILSAGSVGGFIALTGATNQTVTIRNKASTTEFSGRVIILP